MTERLFIITGASRGLGAAMADRLAAPGHVLLCIARHNDPAFADHGATKGARIEQWDADLGRPGEVSTRLASWLDGFDARELGDATLINNAAVLTPVGPLDACSDAEISQALRVGLEAPMLLTAAFLRATREWAVPKRILNISSGLGRRAMAGQAPYCAAKSGMDHYTRAVALDEARRANGARIVSLAPGVIDTDMQVFLRSADAAGFPDKSMFVGLKEGGQLASSSDAAVRILGYLERADFGDNPIADIRDA